MKVGLKTAIIAWVATVFVVIILLVFSLIGFYTYRNGSPSKEQLGDYLVLRRFNDSNKAAAKIHKLGIKAMKVAYADPMYGEGTLAYDAIMQLRRNFHPMNISENDVVTAIGHSSKTTAMKFISLALRKKDGSFHNSNVLDFVFFHELAHVATPAKYLILNGTDDGMHTDHYWAVFAMILHMAKSNGDYKPVDYSKHPEFYNNIHFTNNPYYSHDWELLVSQYHV